MTAHGTESDILCPKKTKAVIMISIITGSDILNGTNMIQGAIMTKRIIEPDIPRNIETKRSCLTSPGTGRDIKNEKICFKFLICFLALVFLPCISFLNCFAQEDVLKADNQIKQLRQKFHEVVENINHLETQTNAAIKIANDKIEEIEKNIHSLESQHYETVKVLNEQESRKRYDSELILISILTGVIGGLVSSFLILLHTECQVRKKFKFLEGKWLHCDRAHKVVKNAYTEITYKRGGKLNIVSRTREGTWKGRIVMDPNMPEYGGGIFQYLDKDVSGLIQTIITAKDIIHVASAATTHEVQFYIWKRQK